MKELCCVCKKEMAVWIYMPGKKLEVYCDNCVSRGCSCNRYYTVGECVELPPTEHTNWKWIEENEEWTYLDEQGREDPCCEYMYDEDGWELQ